MKGDFSRFTFDPTRHYVGVLHQQGRVWLDSDWNEDILERLSLFQQQLNDVVGPCGVPSPGNGFQLSASVTADLDDFQISAGRCYVNGMLCQLEKNISYLTQPDFPHPPRIPIPTDGSTLVALVYLEVWQRLITYLEDPSLREIALGGPDTSARLKTIAQVKVQIIPGGNANTTCAQAAQFLPTPGSGTLTTKQPSNIQPQSLCQLPDPANYTGRQNHLFRVQIHGGGDVVGINSGSAFAVALAADALAGATSLSLAQSLNASQADAAQRAGFVTVSDNSGVSERAALGSISSDGKTLTVPRLGDSYRVANSATVSGGVAQFKWSRDNASFAVNVTDVQPDRQTLTLDSLGRDTTTVLRQGDLVEITDDASELGPARGHLTNLKTDPDPDQFTVALNDPLPAQFGSDHLILRRWDGLGDVASDPSSPALNLGDGIQIQFGGQDLRPGDYWQFATRVADGSVEALLNAPPAGINRSWCPLAVVAWGPPPQTSPPSSPPSGVAMSVHDCRNVFPSLVNFPQADRGFHITGLSTVDNTNAVSPLFNDTNVQVTSFAGINIQCDASVDPASLTRPVCSVMVDYPIGGGDQGSPAYFPIVLNATVSASGSVISWTPAAPVQSFLNQLILADQTDKGVLARLRVRGNFIWSQDDPALFLDGDAFGFVQSGINAVALSFPTGDRRRGGDFEMWFWLVAAPSFVTGIQINPPGSVFVGSSATLVITLSAPAPSGSQVLLSFSNQNVTSTPAPGPSPASPPTFTVNISVPTGATLVSVPIAGVAVGQTIVSASLGGQAAVITLTVSQLTLTGQLSISPATIVLSGSSTGTITITGPAPAGGQAVPLASDNAGVASVPASVTVPEGSATASFTISGGAVGSANITASLGGVSLSAPITVRVKGKEVIKDIRDSGGGKGDLPDKIREAKPSDKFTDKAQEKISDKLSDKISDKIRDKNSDKPRELSPIHESVSSTTALGPSVGGAQRAFILPEERPAVDDSVLKQAEGRIP